MEGQRANRPRELVPGQSGAELTQMMVQVLVHQAGPLSSGQLAEKTVHDSVRGVSAARGEPADGGLQPIALTREFTRVDDSEVWMRRRILAEWLVAEQRLLD